MLLSKGVHVSRVISQKFSVSKENPAHNLRIRRFLHCYRYLRSYIGSYIYMLPIQFGMVLE
ncbi:hypothetical protein BJX61DRAFT_494516 [Aspergillus egyptiacus]|nr:hypothetical protein BJX61DRAFT_494516 [Aspergillus egyptiacus]